MKAASVADPSATGHPTSTLYLVPPRVDRQREGRRLAAPMIGDDARGRTLVQRGIHPDLMELAPPPKKERIGIDQVREVIRIAQFTPVQGERKVCLISRAEALTPEAANALLKTLEEPPRGLVFVLLAEHAGDLLPTIVSRGCVVRIPPSSQEIVLDKLRAAGYGAEEAAWLTQVANQEGEIDPFLEERANIDRLSAAAATRCGALDLLGLIEAGTGDEPILRREALLRLFARMAATDEVLLTTGVHILASKTRETIFLLLQDLLAVCFQLNRQTLSGENSKDGTVRDLLNRLNGERLQKMCTAIDDAHRALSLYGPTEAILLSLFLTSGGPSDGN